jgi:hypothetical protein
MNAQQRERLLTDIQHLTLACPRDNCNPSFCPLHDVRKLAPENRVEWVRALTDDDLEYFATYHQICLQRSEGDGAKH